MHSGGNSDPSELEKVRSPVVNGFLSWCTLTARQQIKVMFCQSHHYIFSTFKPKLSHHFVSFWWWQLVNQRSPWEFFLFFFDLHWLSSQLSVKRCQFRWRRWGSSLTLFQLYIVTQQYLNKTHGVFVWHMSSFLCAEFCNWLSLPSLAQAPVPAGLS